MPYRHRFLPASLAAVVVVGLVGATPAAGQTPPKSTTTLSVESRDTRLAAYDGSLLWSSYEPRLRRYALKALVDGVVQKLPVRTRRIPFDADLGPGPDGRLNAVYSRCSNEKEQQVAASPAQEVLNRRGCRLWRFDFGRRRETRIDTSTPRAASDFRPTIWRGRVAFGRLSSGSGVPRLYVRSGSKGQVRRVRKPRTRLSGAATIYLARLDLRGDRLISSWQYREAQCRSRETARVTGDSASDIFIGSVRRSQRRLLDACDQDEPVEVRDGAWTAGELSVLLRRTKVGFMETARIYSATGRLRREEPFPPSATTYARDRDVQYLVSFRRGESGGPDAFDITRTVPDQGA